MANPRDPREPGLDGDEAELARVLRALPAGEPPARVDAAILAAARDAVASGRPARKPRRLPWWGVGTAAAAVLAVGIGLQLRPGQQAGLPEGLPVGAPGEPVVTPLPAPTPQERSAPPPMQDEAPPPVMAPPPPPPPPPAAPVPEAGPAPLPEAAARQERIEAAKARAREAMDQQLEARSAEREASARRQQALLDRVDVSGSRLHEPAATAAAPDPAAVVAETPSEDSADDAAGTAAEGPAGPAAILPPVDEDARLYPESWLERIRERLRRGDHAGARASLLRYQREYPRHEIPEDLAPLLQ